MPVHVVGAVVRADIAEDVEIQSANGVLNQSLAFAVTEARAGCAHEEVLATHTRRCGHIARQGFFRVLAPLQQPLVRLVAHVLRAAHGNQAQRSNRRRQKGFLIPGTHKVRHRPSTSFRHVSFRGVCVEPPRGQATLLKFLGTVRSTPYYTAFFRIMQRDFTKKTNEILHLDKMVVIFPEVPSF